MSKNYYGSICKDDLDDAYASGHSAFTVAKNGKQYLNIAVWVNDNEDRFGNIASISLSKPKDGTDKTVYIGNLKEGGKKVRDVDSSNDTFPEPQKLPF